MVALETRWRAEGPGKILDLFKTGKLTSALSYHGGTTNLRNQVNYWQVT